MITKKIRESNIELLRSIAMFMILLLHANFVALAYPTIDELTLSPIPQYFRLLLESICIVSVSVFVYISGWFRVRTSIKSVFYFMFQVFFFGGFGYVVLLLCGLADLSTTGLLHGLAIKHHDWFVKAYLFLFILAPVLNIFIDNASEILQRRVVLSFFVLEFVYCWLGGAAFFLSGYSPFIFIGYYLLAQYVKQYINDNNVNNWFIKLFRLPRCTDLSIYLLLVVINTLLVILFSLAFRSFSVVAGKIYSYDNPLVYIGGFYLFLFFVKTKVKYNRVINFIGISSFSVYLLHSQVDIRECFIMHINQINSEYQIGVVPLIVFLYLIFVFALSVIIDQFRIFMWNYLSNSKLFKNVLS